MEIHKTKGEEIKIFEAIHLACTVKQCAVLASPGIGFVALAQIRVLDGILDVVIVSQVPADLMMKKDIN